MLGTYYRTAKCTRWSQLFWRARYNVERRLSVAHLRTSHTDKGVLVHDEFPIIPLFRRSRGAAPNVLAHLRCGIFNHLNCSHELGYPSPDWLIESNVKERLWTVTLHYHEWAHELAVIAAGNSPDANEAAQLFEHYLSDWIDRCSLELSGGRSLAWNAYAIATRICWWIRCYQNLRAERVLQERSFQRKFLHSLWKQAAYLHDHLEWDLRANHLLRDAVGLAWAGRFFCGDQAQRWLATATTLAAEQAREQILTDGGHFERSPMYHMHVMEDLLSLTILLNDPDVCMELRDTWRRMSEYLIWLRHPDGGIPLFNDSAIDLGADANRLIQLGKHIAVAHDASLPKGGRYFADSGMAVWHGDPWTVFVDVGPVGPDYQPGHAHADTLTLECSYFDQRLFVDPGTYAYDNNEMRRYDRSTSAHNTVCIDNTSSSEVWHIFRVGRRAYPTDVDVDISGSAMQVAASHNGYNHLPGRPRHSRRIVVGDHDNLDIHDCVDGRGCHLVQCSYLVAPAWTVSSTNSGWLLKSGSHVVRITVQSAQKLEMSQQQRAYHPEFGHEIQTSSLTWRYEGLLPLEARVTVSTDRI